MTELPPLCRACHHLLDDEDLAEGERLIGVRARCAAFPRGIPRPILDGLFEHKVPYPGDCGVRFRPKE